MTATTPAVIDIVEPPKPLGRVIYEFARRNPTVIFG
jgi:hypothetical protein